METKHAILPLECPGTDGSEWVICRRDKNGKRYTVAHVYDEEVKNEIITATSQHTELIAENERLTAELEMHAWEISPGMAMAKLDVLTADNMSLKELNAKLKADVEKLRRLAQAVCDWDGGNSAALEVMARDMLKETG